MKKQIKAPKVKSKTMASMRSQSAICLVVALIAITRTTRAVEADECAAAEDTTAAKQHRAPIQISDQPRVYVIDDFLTPAECQSVLEEFEPFLEQSQTMSSSGEKQNAPFGRRSRQYTMSPSKWSPLVSGLVERMDATSMQPFANGQHLTVTHYNEGDAYELHVDSAHTVGRVATALIFIKQPVAGGELVFPWARTDTLRTSAARPAGVTGSGRPVEELFSAKQVPSLDSFGACDDSPANEALRIEPRVGRLVVFFNHDPQGRTLRPRSLHGSCPVRGGEKAIAQRFYQWHALDGENRLGALLDSLEKRNGKSEQTVVWWGKEEP